MVSEAQIRKNFWVTNITDRNISLTDLGISIPARKTVDLLNKRYYKFSLEELENSAKTGSLFIKKKQVPVRKVPPVIETRQIIEIDYNATVPSRRRSVVEVEEVRHEELELSDEAFAEQMANLTDPNYIQK